MHPSFIVGGELNEIGTGAVWDGRGDLLVVEADESDGTFLELPAEAVLVTNVEPDHLEHYGTFDALRAAFDPLPRPSPRATRRLRRRRARGRARRGTRRGRLRHRRGGRLPDGRRDDRTRGSAVHARTARRRGVAGVASHPRSAQRAQRRRSDGDGDRARRGTRGGGAGARAVCRGRPPIRAPRAVPAA